MVGSKMKSANFIRLLESSKEKTLFKGCWNYKKKVGRTYSKLVLMMYVRDENSVPNVY